MSSLQVVLSVPRSNQRLSEQLLLVDNGVAKLDTAQLADPPYGGGVTLISAGGASSVPPFVQVIMSFSMSAQFLAENPTDADKIDKINGFFDGPMQLQTWATGATSVTTVVP